MPVDRGGTTPDGMVVRILAARTPKASNGAMGRAVVLWVRADWRQRGRSLVALALLASLAGAVVLTAVAGARLTGASFERLVDDSNAAEVSADVGAVDPDIVD